MTIYTKKRELKVPRLLISQRSDRDSARRVGSVGERRKSRREIRAGLSERNVYRLAGRYTAGKMDDNRHLASKRHSARPQMHAKRPDALSIKSRVIRDHLGQALPNEQRAVTSRPPLNRAAPTEATKLRRGLFFAAGCPHFRRCDKVAIHVIRAETHSTKITSYLESRG